MNEPGEEIGRGDPSLRLKAMFLQFNKLMACNSDNVGNSLKSFGCDTVVAATSSSPVIIRLEIRAIIM